MNHFPLLIASSILAVTQEPKDIFSMVILILIWIADRVIFGARRK